MKPLIFRSKFKVILTLAAVSLLLAGCFRHYPVHGQVLGQSIGKGHAYAGGRHHGGKHGGHGSYGFRGKH